MTAEAKTFELRGWHVLAMLLAFFGVIIAVNVVFAVVAVQSFPGEDVPRSYVQGLRYNETLAQRRAQSELGWRATAALEGGGAAARLVVTLQDRNGAPIDGAVVAGQLEWPTDQRNDRALEFVRGGEGRYVAELDDLRPGRWRLRANAQAASEALDFESELIWRP